MGNSLNGRGSGGGGASSRIILIDCRVVAKEQGSTVAELMLEHPNQFVVDLRSFLANNRAKPLPADYVLQPGKVYLMLPMKSGKAPVTSSREARRLLSRKPSKTKPSPSSSTASCSSFSRVSSSSFRVSSSPSSSVEPPEEFGDSPALTGRHQSARFSWKPSLDTIEEKAARKTLPHWLL